MPSLASEIAAALSQAQRPGDFYASGTLDMHPFRLEVDGIGPIALPLLPAQAEQLIGLAEQAPYGRGPETLVDTDVRRTWQLDAGKLKISGRRWAEDLERAVRQVAEGLGASGQVQAELYKLLIYDAGSFFVSHRDTEKSPGMFATLVMVLPSPFTGGELIIRHKGQAAHLNLRRDEPSEVAFAAFYADCRHEVQPISSGYRLALVYNLVRSDGGPLPELPDQEHVRDEVAAQLRRWQGEPRKLVFPLEHAYTPAELSFQTLKGADASVARVLRDAARAADCDLHLGLVTLHETGTAEYCGNGYWRGGDFDLEVGEVIEEYRYIHHWCSPDGPVSEIGQLDFSDDEISPPDAFAGFDDIEPDFEEATGNAGASYERSYQCAALVLWPQAHRAVVVVDGGLRVSLPYLGSLIERWRHNGGVAGDAGWQQAHGLALAIRDAWPDEGWEARSANRAGHGAALLNALVALVDLTTAADFVAGRIAEGSYDQADNAALVELLGTFAAGRASELLAAVIHGNVQQAPAACAALLSRCSERLDVDSLGPAAQALLAGLPGTPQPADAPAALRYRHKAQQSEQLVADTLSALDQIDAALAAQALALFFSAPACYPMDPVLQPAALLLAEPRESRPQGPAASELRDAVLAHLERRIAEPLEPPADWQRPAELSCRCQQCSSLSRFLASADESVWRLKAPETARGHVQGTIARSQADLDCVTEKVGRPYTLICTKNQASYGRRVRQREQDLAARDRLAPH